MKGKGQELICTPTYSKFSINYLLFNIVLF